RDGTMSKRRRPSRRYVSKSSWSTVNRVLSDSRLARCTNVASARSIGRSRAPVVGTGAGAAGPFRGALTRARRLGTWRVSVRVTNLLGYPAIVLAFVSHQLAHGTPWEPAATFALAAVGVIPLALLMGEATESLAVRLGPTWGGLLNATFGNAAELILAVIALTKGLNAVVKAPVTGSILGNLLLVAGGAMVVGGWRRKEQTFNLHAAEANAGLLSIAVAAMLCPAIFHFSAERLHDIQLAQHEW